MAITVTHSKVSTIPDGTDTSVVRPSDWNATHTLVGVGTAASLDAGVANGVATLDSGGQVPLSQLPPLGDLNYQGTWNATTNSPTLTSSVGTKGYYYVVSVAGSINLNGITDWQVGDWAVYNGTAWQKIDNTDAVTSVNGYTGTVVLTQTDISGTVPTSRTITAGTGLTGGGDLSANRTLAIATTGVSAATYGSASIVPVIAVNTQGQITSATNTTIAIANTQVSGLGTMSTQNANAVAVTGGTINGTTIGATTASTGAFTFLSTSSTTSTTPTLSFNGSNSNIASGAIVSGSYLQNLLQNKSGTANASTNYVLSNDLGTDSTYYGEFGMNSSVYSSGTPADFFSLNNGVYFSGHDGDVTVGSGNGYKTYFAWGTSGQSAHVINASGAIGLNTSITGSTNFGTNGQVLTSAGSGATPTWTTISSGSGTVTSVATAGTVNGLTLTGGPITTTGTVTLGGTLDLSSPPTIGNTAPNTGKFTSLEATGTSSLGTASTTYVTITGDASYPMVKATGGTNTPLVLSPLGTGALQAQKTDSTATGGNARGANAVDWQTSRSAASQVASGLQSVLAGGVNNTSSGIVSTVAGGSTNIASSQNSFVGGGGANTASSLYTTVVGGLSNTSAGFFNFIGAGFTNSGTANAAVTTQATTTVTSGSTAVTLSGSNANIKVGQLITGTGMANYTYVAAISGTSLTLSQNASASGSPTLSFFTPHGVVVGGGNNQATGAYSFIGGGGDAGTAANRNVASGDWSFVGGGVKNLASGIGAFIGGGGINSSATTVSGNTASGAVSCILGGNANQATQTYSSVVGGYTNQATGAYSIVVGGSYGSTRAISGYVAIPASVFTTLSTIGGSQAGILVLAKQTTDATATVITSDGSAASGTNQVILPNNSAYYFKASIISGVTGGGNSKAWTIEGLIKRGANAASAALVGTPVVNIIAADAGASTWAIAATADTSNGGLAITFTGQAGTTIRTVCKVETTEMTY